MDDVARLAALMDDAGRHVHRGDNMGFGAEQWAKIKRRQILLERLPMRPKSNGAAMSWVLLLEQAADEGE